MTEIIISIVGAAATIVAVVINSRQSRKDMVAELRLQQERADAQAANSNITFNDTLFAGTISASQWGGLIGGRFWK